MEAGQTRFGRLWLWLDQRVGLADLEKLARKKEIPVHRHSIWYYLGGMTLFLFIIQVSTGILLLLYYRPSAEEALFSITPRMKARITAAAGHFIAANPAHAARAMRFDVVAVCPPFSIRHLDNAWQTTS